MSSSNAAEPVGFTAVAAVDPDRVAVIDTDGTSTTFGELAQRVNQLSRALRESGMQPGECVVAMLPNRRPYYELRPATAQIGLYFTPAGHHFTTAEIAYILRDSRAGAVVVDASLIDVITPALAEVDLDPRRRIAVGGAPGWVDYEALLAGYLTAPLEDPISGEYMGYTSGTTGRRPSARRSREKRPPCRRSPSGTWVASGSVPAVRCTWPPARCTTPRRARSRSWPCSSGIPSWSPNAPGRRRSSPSSNSIGCR